MKTLKKIDKARVMFREIECDEKLKKMMSQRINPNVEKSYNIGEHVYFYDDKRIEWKRGTALVRLGTRTTKVVLEAQGEYVQCHVCFVNIQS